MIKYNNEILRNDITILNLSDKLVTLLKERQINTIGNLCDNTKTDLKNNKY